MNHDWESLKKNQLAQIKSAPFDHLAFSVINFKTKSSESWLIKDNKLAQDQNLYFDLASLTKALTLGVYFLKCEDNFTAEMLSLLEHRAGLPAYGILSKDSWRETIKSYPIDINAPTLYSDYSSLRLMLEIGSDQLKKTCETSWREILFWKDLTAEQIGKSVSSGAPKGLVHDPNALIISDFCSHAGLFGTIKGVTETLLHLNENFQLLAKNIERSKYKVERPYFQGWDSVMNTDHTLAGAGAGENAFGFLGFTGTCMWLDPQKELGWVMLTNATKKYWHERKILNELRRSAGEFIWKSHYK